MVGIYRGSYFIVYFPLHLHQFSLLVKVVFNVGFASRCAVSIKHRFFVSCTSHAATIHPPQIIKTTTQRWVDMATAQLPLCPLRDSSDHSLQLVKTDPISLQRKELAAYGELHHLT